jgi:hypothetical protein
MSDSQTTREDRVPHMRQTWREITESDNGESELMADYRWACDEIERLRGIEDCARYLVNSDAWVGDTDGIEANLDRLKELLNG